MRRRNHSNGSDITSIAIGTQLRPGIVALESPINEDKLARFKRRFARLTPRDRELFELVVVKNGSIRQVAQE
jgi:hypothetical protein